jgi:hypothetical protein
MTTSDHINEIAVAMAKAQAAMKPAIKDATNPAFRSKYADLASVWEACRNPLTSHGIAVWQDVTMTIDGIAVTTRLVHSSGQWVEFGPLIVPLVKKDAHGVGSATSYGKRYALSAAVGIVSDDDDGNAAAASARPAATARPEPEMRGFIEEAPRPAPMGFHDWFTDLVAVADEGTDRLSATWANSKPEYRRYLLDTDNSGWETLKRKAAKVGTPVGSTR